MQSFLKIFGVIALSVIVVGLIIPNKVDVRRSITINAPVETIHQYTNDLKMWPKWSPWVAQDPSIKTTFGDITEGKGASQTWTGAGGNGEINFIQSSLDSGIQYEMRLQGDGTVFNSGFDYQPQGEKTIVVWYMTGEMQPVIIGNYFSLLMDSLVGDSYLAGLEKLKVLAESQTQS